MKIYNAWEIKQILELTSKSLNSHLINGKNPSGDLKKLAFEYVDLYAELLDYLKAPTMTDGSKTKDMKQWQEKYNDLSKAEELRQSMGNHIDVT